ncbi:pirin family protein [Brucellaceae bacterium VT-16-1752]|nr:pirin family protein [Brucellaceae bacterium VT-16-1752]
MTNSLPQRDVARIDKPEIKRGITESHRVRPLVEPGDFTATDPFLLLMEDWFPLGVFDRHPHRGIETVTYVVDGAVDHYDNHGNEGLIEAGDALWLTAGRGIVHNEQPANGAPVHLLQLWVNLPAANKLVPAHFQDLRAADMPVRRVPGAEIRVFSGASGSAVAPTTNYAPVTMVEARIEPNARIEQELPAGFNGFIVVVEGAARVGTSAADVQAGQVAWLTRNDAESAITIAAGKDGARAIVFAGQPLNEPVAARGPFVMNTKEELDAGFAELRRTGERFGL